MLEGEVLTGKIEQVLAAGVDMPRILAAAGIAQRPEQLVADRRRGMEPLRLPIRDSWRARYRPVLDPDAAAGATRDPIATRGPQEAFQRSSTVSPVIFPVAV